MSLKATVVILTKNPGTVFRQVLNAVCNQQVNFLYEILVLDSGSTDGTTEFVLNHKGANIRLHEIAPSSFGHGKTRNLGVSLSLGEYVVMLTHDACPATPEWLKNLVQMADSDPKIAGVFGKHIAYPEANIFTKQELEVHFSGFNATPIVELEDYERYQNDAGYRQFLHFFSDNNALIRKSVWNKIPYPDVDFAEDQIWAQKVIEAGFRKGYAKDAIVFHSHDYALIERLQRSFDESYAFLKLFGYILSPSLKSVFRSWSAITLRDFKFAISEKLWRKYFFNFLCMPLDNLMRLFGHYLGSRGDQLPIWLKMKLSRDNRVFDGQLKLKQDKQ